MHTHTHTQALGLPPPSAFCSTVYRGRGVPKVMGRVVEEVVADNDDDEDHEYENDYMIPELLPFEINAERLRIMHELGAGQFGQVFAAWLEPGEDSGSSGGDSDSRLSEEKEGRLVAVKSCKAPPEDMLATRQFMQEAQTLARFNHENVLGLIGVVTEEKPLRIVIEHVPYGDLKAVLKGCRRNSIVVNELEKMHIAMQVASGMDHLVQKKFVHRDLAARNVLLGRYCSVKIADFGLSRQLEDETQNYIVRSRCLLPVKWMAPESLLARVFTHASDVYSFGVLMWEVETQAKTPWKKSSTEDVVRRVKAGECLPCPSSCPQAVYDIMLRCWKEVSCCPMPLLAVVLLCWVGGVSVLLRLR